MLKQYHWRIAGAVTLAGAGLMFWFGMGIRFTALWQAAAYWLTMLLLVAIALYCALLDIRHINAEYAIQKRELFKATLGDEALRKALREAERKAKEKGANKEG